MTIQQVYQIAPDFVVAKYDTGLLSFLPYPSELPAAKEVDAWVAAGGVIEPYPEGGLYATTPPATPTA